MLHFYSGSSHIALSAATAGTIADDATRHDPQEWTFPIVLRESDSRTQLLIRKRGIGSAEAYAATRTTRDRRNARFPFPLDLIRDSTTSEAHVRCLSRIVDSPGWSIDRTTDWRTDDKTRFTTNQRDPIVVTWPWGSSSPDLSPKQRTLADNTQRPWLRSLLRTTVRANVGRRTYLTWLHVNMYVWF